MVEYGPKEGVRARTYFISISVSVRFRKPMGRVNAHLVFFLTLILFFMSLDIFISILSYSWLLRIDLILFIGFNMNIL